MHKIRIDKYKNRMILAISGCISHTMAFEIMHEIEYHATQLEIDFDVLIDVRFFKPTTLDVLNQIKVVKQTLREHGSRYGVFAIGSSTYALNIFAKFANFHDKDLFFVPSMRDAEHKMDELTSVNNV